MTRTAGLRNQERGNPILHNHKALPLASPCLDDVKPLDDRKAPFVERGQVDSTFEGSRGYDQVISSDHFAL